MSRETLRSVLDYILNKASEDEFEAIVKACERRRRDLTLFASIGGVNPERAAKNAAEAVESSMGASMDGIRQMIRDFVADIIRKNAPEVTEDQMKELLEAYVPEPETRKASERTSSPIPPEALLKMVKDFTDYSLGLMAPSAQQSLWERMPRWKEEYWEAFPPELKAFIKAFLENRIDAQTFWGAVYSVLGL
jgi:hypothetical protein